MKTNGRIRELLATPCFNDIEYGHRVIWPLLDYLGIPLHARRPQFQIENPFGNGLLRLDYLLHHEDLPLVTIEGEPTARQFETGYRQAKNYSRNFKPRQVLLVEVREHWQDGEGVERKTDLFGELEATVNRYLGVE